MTFNCSWSCLRRSTAPSAFSGFSAVPSLFVRFGRTVFRFVHPAAMLIGNQFGGTCLSNPFPPLGLAFVCQAWPICTDEECVWSLMPCTIDPAGRPGRPLVKIRFDQIQTFEAKGGEVLINHQPFLWLDDEVAATFFVSVLRERRVAQPAQRKVSLASAMASTFQLSAIAARVHQLRLLTKRLIVHCHVMALLFAIGLPLIIGSHHVRPYWTLFLGLFIGLQLTILRGFHVAHRALMPEASRYRLHTLAVMFLRPTASIRACDFLARHLLSSFHPLAVAAVLCRESDASSFARCMLNDARHPLPSGDGDVSLHSAIKGSAAQLYQQMTRTLHTKGWQETLSTKPRTPRSDSRAYCPRCECDYRVTAGTCSTCGLPLHPFEDERTV